MSHNLIHTFIDYWTYEEIAEHLGTTKETLYSLASRYPGVLEPTTYEKLVYLFDEETVTKFLAWWEEHSRFRADVRPDDEMAYTVSELEASLDIPFTTIQYYRRRYGQLYPDFYADNPSGRGRPVAMYLDRTIKEWQAWVASGRPEIPSDRVKDVQFAQGRFEAIVTFGDGTVAGLLGEEWRISPPPDSASAQKYIKLAVQHVARRRYAAKWAKKPKAETE